MKVKLRLQVSDGQELYLAFCFLFVQIQDVSDYAMVGYCFRSQSIPSFSLAILKT